MSSFTPDPVHADPTTTPPDSASTDSAHNYGTHQTANDNASDTDPSVKKKKASKRRKVNHACLYCRRSHMTCDEGRPCQRW